MILTEEKVSPVKPKKNRLVKRLSLARGAKHLEKAAENKRNSTGNSQDTKGPPEDGEVKVKQEKSDTPTRKKIALTTVSNIGEIMALLVQVVGHFSSRSNLLKESGLVIKGEVRMLQVSYS